MKSILRTAVLASVALAGSTSCSDFLDQESASEYTSGSVYSSTYNTGLTINRIYGCLCQDRTYSQSMSIHIGTNTDCELVDGLNITSPSGNGERVWGNYWITPSYYSAIGEIYTELFEVVENCNLSIEGIRQSPLLSSGTASQKKAMQAYLGEALTLRAMTYLDIVRLWGDVPAKFETSKSDLSNAYLGKTDRDEILDQLMTDLDEAAEYLPWAGENSDYSTEHATKGYAKALCAQIALTRAGYAIRESAKDGYVTASNESRAWLGKTTDNTYPTQRPSDAVRQQLYQRAKTLLEEVINSGHHALNPSFENEWYLINQRSLDKTYQENLFEIPMGVGVNSELGYTIGVRLNGATTEFGYQNSSGKVKLTANLLYSYDPKDERRDVTCAQWQIKDVTRNGSKVTIDEPISSNAPFGIYVAKYNPRWMNSEWKQINLSASDKVRTGINCVKMRYSQVLLMYAEVCNELGDLAKAKEALSEVHCRAFATADKAAAQQYVDAIDNSQSAIFDAIVKENAWELAGECARKWDLIRWNLLSDKIDEMKAEYKDAIDNAKWPEKVYYKYSDAAKTLLDLSSFTWYETPANTAEYDGSFTAFGAMNATQYNTNLPALSSGLNSQGVINRYITPLYTTTISSSNGALQNSYGW